MGYRRPGLMMLGHHDARLHHRWEGAFLAFQRHAKGVTEIPTFFREEMTSADFSRWFKKCRPDVVLSHDSEAMTWMRDCGARIPETHGFFCLNNAIAPPGRCAGLDQQPSLIGTRAAELVIAQLHRNEFGLSEHPTLTTIQARWCDGPSLRSLTKKTPRPRWR